MVPGAIQGSFLTKRLRQVFAKYSFLPEFLSGKPEKLQPRKNSPLKFFSLFREKLKFRYKGVEDRAAAPLKLCQHSRAHNTEQVRSQAHWQVMTNRRRRSEFLFSLRRVDKVTDHAEAADRTSSLRAVTETFVTFGVVVRRVGDGFHSPRHEHLPTSQADSRGTTTRVISASGVAVVTVLYRYGRLFCEPTDAYTREDSTLVDFGKISKFHHNRNNVPGTHTYR